MPPKDPPVIVSDGGIEAAEPLLPWWVWLWEWVKAQLDLSP